MIKLVYCIRRRSDISVAEFNEYWWTEHGSKVRSVAKDIGALRYVQSYICAPALNQVLLESRQLAEAYDGITEVWWESEEIMSQAMGTSDGAAGMQLLLEDEATFIDFSRSRVFMTIEREVFDYTAGES
jgi:hypothetical protein